jgi:dTMP kinase
MYTSPSLSALGQCINERLNVSEDEDQLVNFILLLADRMTQILGSKGIIKNLEQGKVVLCDRFYHSLIVYQGDFTSDYFLNSSNYLVKDLVDFDLLFYLDVSPEITYSWICKRGEVIEREEKIEKLIEKRQKYLRVLSEESDKEKIWVIWWKS